MLVHQVTCCCFYTLHTLWTCGPNIRSHQIQAFTKIQPGLDVLFAQKREMFQPFSIIRDNTADFCHT